jgi:hypothetical protein
VSGPQRDAEDARQSLRARELLAGRAESGAAPGASADQRVAVLEVFIPFFISNLFSNKTLQPRPGAPHDVFPCRSLTAAAPLFRRNSTTRAASGVRWSCASLRASCSVRTGRWYPGPPPSFTAVTLLLPCALQLDRRLSQMRQISCRLRCRNLVYPCLTVLSCFTVLGCSPSSGIPSRLPPAGSPAPHARGAAGVRLAARQGRGATRDGPGAGGAARRGAGAGESPTDLGESWMLLDDLG